MPINNLIIVHCGKEDCFWYIEETRGNNCAAKKVTISDGECSRYIEKTEAERRLSNAD